ncbi:MAG: hydro-lyase, tartrate/fumarate family [bacterium P3]|nr:MAG: hydro-lyase, tartrate/fumarate family [bacterium P3]KWW42501.1 MAG: hydro-lyase, tartrate/fumarate family [bacterium F083]
MKIQEKVADCLVRAGSTFREDQKAAYRRAIAEEKNEQSCWVMRQVLDNALVAEERRSPLCDDTGIPHLFLEVGKTRSVSGGMMQEIMEGIALGLRQLPGRPMAIKGDDSARIDQSGGLNEDSGALEPSPILIKPVDEDVLRLTVLMLGGGPAIRGVTQRVFHKHSVDVVIDEIVSRATEGVSKLGCSPCVLAVGVGRSQFEATSLMMEAMAHGDFGKQTAFERRITDKVNTSGIGPLGLGGSHSVLATFAKVGPQRASGVRIVALRPCCCFEPRRASVDL